MSEQHHQEDDSPEVAAIKVKWEVEQKELRSRYIGHDDFDFHWSESEEKGDNQSEGRPPLKYIGGVDISFVDGNPEDACASLVVLEYPSLKEVYASYTMVKLTQPYIPGFLAFREVGHLVAEVDKVREAHPEFVPQVIMVDGNGILHYRKFGVASHLGVLTGIPCIGVAKNLLCVEQLRRDNVAELTDKHLLKAGDSVQLVGESGFVYGAALKPRDNVKKPIFISSGHKVSLATALSITTKCCNFRIPEPVRHADLGSRQAVRDWLAAQQA